MTELDDHLLLRLALAVEEWGALMSLKAVPLLLPCEIVKRSPAAVVNRFSLAAVRTMASARIRMATALVPTRENPT